MEQKVINVASDFSRYPAGRYLTDGPNNGEKFRKEHLLPALRETQGSVIVNFEGARGLGSSFLDEAFGGLIREGFTAKELHARLTYTGKDATLGEEIRSYIDKVAAEAAK
jgi:hypothetical protein